MSDWKDKRIEAINRVCERKNLTCSPDSPYFDEVIDIYNSEATSLQDFKLERKKRNEKRREGKLRPFIWCQNQWLIS